MRSYCLSIVDNSLAVREDANGTRRQVMFRTPETNSCWQSAVIVGQKCRTDIGSGLLIYSSLDSMNNSLNILVNIAGMKLMLH